MIEPPEFPVYPIELRHGACDGTRLGLFVEPPPIWEMGELPSSQIQEVPGCLARMPMEHVRIHRYRRSSEITADGGALIYFYDPDA